MFRIDATVEDKQLAEILRALSNAKAQINSLTPVINAVMKNGEATAIVQGDINDMVIAHFKEQGKFNIAELRRFLRSIGRSPKSAASTAQRMVDNNLVSKSKKREKRERMRAQFDYSLA